MIGLFFFRRRSIYWIVTLFTLHHLLPNGFHSDYRLFQVRHGSIISHFSSEASNCCQTISDRQKTSTITSNGTPILKLVEAFTSIQCSIISPISRKQTLPNQVCFPQRRLIVKHLSADSNNNNNIDKVSFCWSKLIVNGEIVGSPTRLILDSSPVIMDGIKKMMKLEFMDDLGGISAARLEIYAANDNEAKTALKASTEWNPNIHGGDTEENALMIKVNYPEARAQAKAETAEAKSRAQSFVDALISSKYEGIDNSDGMKVLRNIPILETGETLSIFVRSETQRFWQACIDRVNTPSQRYRVAAVGTPGIGKTMTTPVLIRMLLEQKKTVVYHIRKLDKDGWYYEFTPQGDGTVIAQVYPESFKKSSIDSLKKRDTYYIVDPGQTKDDCRPAADFLPKVIIVISPDEGHVGSRNEFEKKRGGSVRGFFLINPTWSLRNVLALQSEQELGNFTEDEIQDRYRMFGGVPRRVFTEFLKEELELQDTVISALSLEQVRKIATGEMDAIGDFSPGAPKGILLAFEPENDINFAKGSRGAPLVSPMIQEKVYSRYIKELWNVMINAGEVVGRTLFEPYVRNLIQKNELELEARRLMSSTKKTKKAAQADAVRVRSTKKTKKATQAEIVRVKIPRCPKVRLVTDPAISLKAADKCTLLHSSNPNYPLFDCILMDAHGQIHAVQITTGEQHSISLGEMNILYNKVIKTNATKINLYYFVPSNNFQKFTTTPATVAYDPEQFDVFVVSIPNPNDELGTNGTNATS